MGSSLKLIAPGAFRTVSEEVLPRPSDGGYQPDASTVLLYKFNEASDKTAFDASVNGNNGIIHGAESVTGRYGRGLGFDGINDRVLVPEAPSFDLTSALTIEAWVKPVLPGFGAATILSKRGAYTLRIVETPALKAVGSIWRHGIEEQVFSISDIRLERWNHVAFAFDGTSLGLLIGGDPDISKSVPPGDLDTNTEPVYLGVYKKGPGMDWFLGVMDEVRLSGMARAAAELDPNTW